MASTSSAEAPPSAVRRHGEPWALGFVLGYASANMFDGLAMLNADTDPRIGPVLRGLPSLLLGIVLVWKYGTLKQLRPTSPEFIGVRAIWAFVAAGVISTVGLFFYYYAIRFGGVTITVPAQETYVLWGTLIAWLFLGERTRAYALAGVGLTFVGLVVLSLGKSIGQAMLPHWYWAIPLGLLTGLTYGVSGVLWRDGQLRGAHQSTAIFLQFSTSTLVGLIGASFAVRNGALHAIVWNSLGALVASGVLSGVVAIYCMFTALRLLAVARVYAFSSLTPLVATLFAYFALREYLNLVMVLGILLVGAGVVLTQIFRPRDERQA